MNDQGKNDDRKTKTKIPVSRFRQTVEKVKVERRESKEKERPMRRSSIPKLAINKTAPVKPVRKAIAATQTTQIVTQSTAPEDEFDKLYEEVVCSTPTPVNIDVSLLNPKVDDPEKIEHNFEEIIHDYDENKVEPIDVERIRKSKIPFLKRKSQQDIEVQGDRSSKIIAARDKLRIRHNSTKSDEQNDKKQDETIKAMVDVNDKRDENLSTPKTEVRSQYTKTIITSSKGNEEDDSTKVISTTLVTEVETIASSDKIEHKKGQIIEENIYKDCINVGIPVFDSYVHEYTEKSETEKTVEVKRVLSYTSKNEDFENDKTEAELEITEIYNENEPTIVEIVENTEPEIVEIKDISENSFESLKPELSTEKQRELDDTKVLLKEKDSIEDKTKLQGKVGRLISKIDLHDAVDKEVHKIDFGKGLPKNKSVMSRIAMFERHEAEPASKSKLPSKDTKISKLLTTDTQRTEHVHIHTPLIVDEVFKPFQAITDNTNNDVTTNGVEKYATQIVTAEMVVIESPETVHYDVENKVQIESNTLFIEQSKVSEEILTPVLRKYEFENNGDTREKDVKDVDTKLDVPVLIPKFIPVREVLKKYESLNGLEVHASNKTIEDLPKIRPISEIISNLTPEVSYRSLDAMFAHQVRPISEILNDMNPQEFQTNEIKNNVFVTEESDIKKEFTVDDSNEVFDSKEIEAKNDTSNKVDKTQNDLKSYKSRDIEFKTLNSTDNNFKSLQFIQDYVKSKSDDLKRAKSVAELDLGDAVKGKVNRMIVRINSVDKIDVGIKEVPINIKELPRKRSVSEKIALFERKLTPAKEVLPPLVNKQETPRKQLEEPAVTQKIKKPQITTQPEKLTAQTELTADIQEKIQQLSNAKLKYGKMETPRMELANGMMMPVLAVGTALLDPRLAYYIVTAAIDLGYRAIDTAYIYGNEKVIGEAIRAKINDGTVTREDLFIMSKLWSTFHKTDLVKAACEASLEAMGLEYFDLYLIHNPMSLKEGGSPIPKIATVLQYSEFDYMDAWFGMETLGAKVKALGVSNFNSAQLQRVVDRARVKPVINQVECHPYLSQQRLDSFCSERNIRLSCFGVLGSKGTPLEFKSGQTPVIDDALVQVMASGLNVSPAQLLIRYQLECGHNVVVKSSSAAHLWDNLQALTFNLTSGQVDALHALNRNKRNFIFRGMGDTHKNYPFNTAF